MKKQLGLGFSLNANPFAENFGGVTTPLLLFIDSVTFVAMVSQIASTLGTVLFTFTAINPVLDPLRQRQS